MQRYFVKNADRTAVEARVSGQDYHHVKNVMRMKSGAEAAIVDEDGRVRLGVLRAFVDGAACFDFARDLPGAAEGPRVAIAQALIKKDRFELMLEKATELGACEIIPTAFSRSVVKIETADATRKQDRFQLIAKEAAQQSRRALVTAIGPVTKLQDLPFDNYDIVFVCYEAATPAEALTRRLADVDLTSRLLFVVGPEGGITPAEFAFLQEKGALAVSLGSRILRSETASMYLLAAIDALWEGRR